MGLVAGGFKGIMPKKPPLGAVLLGGNFYAIHICHPEGDASSAQAFGEAQSKSFSIERR